MTNNMHRDILTRKKTLKTAIYTGELLHASIMTSIQLIVLQYLVLQ